MIDYRDLLRRYMDHVFCYEGTMFLGYLSHGNDFSDEEIAELEKLGSEIEK